MEVEAEAPLRCLQGFVVATMPVEDGSICLRSIYERMKEMRAAILHGSRQPFEIRDVDMDKPWAHEIVIRVAASGLCHSDYHYVTGDLPFVAPSVLGHEAAGIVEAVGQDVTSVVVGDHVVTCVTAFCGHCTPCVSGRNHMCQAKPRRGEADAPRLSIGGQRVSQGGHLGGFAELMLVHEHGVVKVDRTLPLDRGALLGCGVVTGLGAVFNAAKVTPGSRVAVIGCGGVGLNVIQGARIAGAAQIIAIDLMPEKLALARHFGATHGVIGSADTVQEVRELSGGGVDFAFEVIGLPHTIEQAVTMMATGGLMTIVGATPAGVKITLPGIPMLMNEWRVQGTYIGSAPFTRDIPRFAAMYQRGVVDLDTLVGERIALESIDAGFETMRNATQARSVITFPDVLAHAARAA